MLPAEEKPAIDWAAVMARIPQPEQELIGKIVQRAVDMVAAFGVRYDANTLGTATHDAMAKICHLHSDIGGKGCRLKLLQWLMSDGHDFAQDYHGIVMHLDTRDGSLRNGFWPRFAEQPREGAQRIITPH